MVALVDKTTGVPSNTRFATWPRTLAFSPSPRPGDAMRKTSQDTYVCTLCNATVVVSGEERPVVMLAADSGQPNVRIVSVANVEVHRCVIADEPTAARL